MFRSWQTCKQAAEAKLFSETKDGPSVMNGNLEGPKTFGSDYFVGKLDRFVASQRIPVAHKLGM